MHSTAFDYSAVYYAVVRQQKILPDTIIIPAKYVNREYNDRYAHVAEVKIADQSPIHYKQWYGFIADCIESSRFLTIQEICAKQLIELSKQKILCMSSNTADECAGILRHALHYLFPFVPDEFKTAEMCRRAVRTGSNASYVPHDLMTEDLCNEIIGDPRGGCLVYVPRHMRSWRICMRAVQLRGSDLVHVPRHILTKDFCRAAIDLDAENLCYIPEDLKTEELCVVAVKLNSNAIKYVPHKFQTTELFDIVRQSYAAYIKDVGHAYHSYMCE